MNSGFSNVLAVADQVILARNRLYALSGIDWHRSQWFMHTFDNLNGWAIESTVTGNARTVVVTGSDSVVAATGLWTFTGGTFTANDVGGLITVAGATNAGNNKTLVILAAPDATHVQTATTGLVNETFSGAVTLSVTSRVGGQSGANSPVTAAEYHDGKSFMQLGGGGLDTIMRGWVSNVAGTYTLQIPRPIMLDQVTPCGFAFQFALTADSGSYVLGGFADPTSSGLGTSPNGVYVGFAHAVGAFNYAGYKFNGSVGDQMVSSVPLDGGWHVGYVWADGSGSYKFRVDNEPVQALPNAGTFANVKACVRIAMATALPRVSWCTAIWPGVG